MGVLDLCRKADLESPSEDGQVCSDSRTEVGIEQRNNVELKQACEHRKLKTRTKIAKTSMTETLCRSEALRWGGEPISRSKEDLASESHAWARMMRDCGVHGTSPSSHDSRGN